MKSTSVRSTYALFIVLCLTWAMASSAEVRRVSEESLASSTKRMGVRAMTFKAQTEGREQHVEIWDGDGLSMGIARILDAEIKAVTLETATGDRVQLAIDFSTGFSTVRDLNTGLEGSARLDLQANSWVKDDQFLMLESTLGDVVNLSAAVIGEFDRVRRAEAVSKRQATSSPDCDQVGDSIAPFDAKRIGCPGWYNCRGFAIAGSESGCCLRAENDVNLCCWNSACTGCCERLECDTNCLLGDFICHCGMSGSSCSTTNVP